MGLCTHPRSQGYIDDDGRSRCGACGDVWDNDKKMFVPLVPLSDPPPLDEGPLASLYWKQEVERLQAVIAGNPRVVICDVRNGSVYDDGVNIDIPPEGLEPMLEAIERADILIDVTQDGVWVKRGYGVNVLLVRTKTEAQMSGEKADREKAARAKGPEQTVGMTDDRETFEDDPVDAKFKRVWDGSVPSGEPVKGGLKGF